MKLSFGGTSGKRCADGYPRNLDDKKSVGGDEDILSCSSMESSLFENSGLGDLSFGALELLSSTALSSFTICPYIFSSLTRFCCLVSMKSSRLLVGDNILLLPPILEEASVVEIVPDVIDKGIPVLSLPGKYSGTFHIGIFKDPSECPNILDKLMPTWCFDEVPISEPVDTLSVHKTLIEFVL